MDKPQYIDPCRPILLWLLSIIVTK